MTLLHVAYRPKDYAQVVGQDAAVRALEGLFDNKASRAVLLSGPSGVGKTTLARISARRFGCTEKDILEIDAATHTGIDAMREVQEALKYMPFGSNSFRAVIIDECHSISRQAWQSLLKIIEEPPAHVIWFLCTTELSRVPQTIKTRCSGVQLKTVSEPDLQKLYRRVSKKSGVDVPTDVRDVVIGEADGSPRQMLVNLALCSGAETRAEARELLQTARESDPLRELCLLLIKGGSWQKAMSIYAGLETEPPESVRIGVCNYIGGALRNAKTSKDASRFLTILDEFAQPFGTAEHAMLLLCIGRVLVWDR